MDKSWMIFAVVVMLALTACGSGNNATSNKRAFIGGTQGLVFTFMPEEPPAEVTSSNYPFSTTVKIENKGETEVAKDKIHISLKGIDATDFGVPNANTAKLTDVQPDSDLSANQINPDTGEIIASSPAYATFHLQYSKPITGNHEFPFLIDTCYEYETKANAEVCLKQNLLDNKNTKVCTPTGPRALENSGAPVQVSSFLEYTSGTSAIRFTLSINKVGTGDVFKQKTTCDMNVNNPGVNQPDKDVVHVKITTELNGQLTCSGLGANGNDGNEGDVKMITGIKQITCVQKLEGDDQVDKIKIANVDITYDYLESIQTKVLVKQVSQ